MGIYIILEIFENLGSQMGIYIYISLSDLRSTWISRKIYDFHAKKWSFSGNCDISDVIEYFYSKSVLTFQWAPVGMFRA